MDLILINTYLVAAGVAGNLRAVGVIFKLTSSSSSDTLSSCQAVLWRLDKTEEKMYGIYPKSFDT